MEFTKENKRMAKEVISAGLAKAAESLSFFMNEKIELDTSDDRCLDCDPLDLDRKGESNIHLLITKVVGDIQGICCLIFSEEEADHLRNVALPAEIKSNPEMMAEMSDGILLEVDNIISASVITHFSNTLKLKMHGDVPVLKKVDYKEMIEFIRTEISDKLYLVSFKTSFSSSNVKFNPEFLWLFEKNFVSGLTQYYNQIEQDSKDLL
jgi:chemotaxis protein CheY-P-specific phosphatase CheC